MHLCSHINKTFRDKKKKPDKLDIINNNILKISKKKKKPNFSTHFFFQLNIFK